jgi:hypothetical protein
VTQLQWTDEARELMAPSAQASPWALVSGFMDVMRDAHLWRIQQGRADVLLALRGTDRSYGRLMEVVGMRSVGERFRAADLGPVVEHLVRTAYDRVDLISMCTRHPHLVRACERDGWTPEATIVNKALRLQ